MEGKNKQININLLKRIFHRRVYECQRVCGAYDGKSEKKFWAKKCQQNAKQRMS